MIHSIDFEHVRRRLADGHGGYDNPTPRRASSSGSMCWSRPSPTASNATRMIGATSSSKGAACSKI